MRMNRLQWVRDGIFCAWMLGIALSCSGAAGGAATGATSEPTGEGIGESRKAFVPDPVSVQHEGPAYRYPQAGWIFVHVEGEPYERGYQQGKLLAPEIEAYVKCYAATQSSKSPSDGWRLTRTLVNSLFLRRYDPELVEEMRGIADGAAAGGAKFDGRAIDLTDIVAINAWAELSGLDDANQATPTGLEGRHFKGHCSAFAACGPATADGKIVIGHTSMWDLYPSLFFNVWLDVKPAHGHRMSFQGYPGAVNSGMDWYQTDAGLVVVETTIDQTKFNASGECETSRIRRAVQYAENIDDVVRILKQNGNGLYANEWLIADTRRNEIAMLDLGTDQSRLWRSSRNEWFGDTPGFYWSCNNEKDLAVRLETEASEKQQPMEALFRPEDRDEVWVKLYEANKGHIGAGFGKLAFSTPILVSSTSLDAKYTTTVMQQDHLSCAALYGPPLGIGWEPTFFERKKYPAIHEMVSNPWTRIAVDAPVPPEDEGAVKAADLPTRTSAVANSEASGNDAGGGGGDFDDNGGGEGGDGDSGGNADLPWTGTLLPHRGRDAWLASAFAVYQPIAQRLSEKLKDAESNPLSPEDRQEMGLDPWAMRSSYLATARESQDTPLAQIQPSAGDRAWYRIARGKGVVLLSELRNRLGIKAFCELMKAYGNAFGGKPADADVLAAMAEQKPYNVPKAFFDYWLSQAGLPNAEWVDASYSAKASGGFAAHGKLRITPAEAIASIEVTAEIEGDEKTQTFPVKNGEALFEIETDKPVKRLVANKYAAAPLANGEPYQLGWFATNPQHALIIYGTLDEADANREAASKLQRTIMMGGSNVRVTFKSDQEVSDDDLRGRHLLLIGGPACNRVTAKMANAFDAEIAAGHFTVGGKTYASPGSVLIIEGANPMDEAWSVELLAGLSAEATVTHAAIFAGAGGGQAMVLANGQPTMLVLPAKDLVREVSAATTGPASVPTAKK
jgi:hypothetical protein